MLSTIIRFSVHNKLFIALFTLALVVGGIFAASGLPVDAVPDITNNQVQVITQSPSLAAPEVERLITFPVEQATSSIPGLIEMRSFSRFGLSLVTLVFSDDTDVYWARQQVSERLQQIRQQIPPDAGNPELAPVTTGLGEIFQYAVRARKGYEAKYDAMELRTIQDWIIRRQLLGTPGVADVSSFGGHLKQYEVAVNTARLHSFRLSINDLFEALAQNNQNTGGAYIEKGKSALFIRSEGLAQSPEDIGRIIVRNLPGGIPVFIRDVAEVRTGHATRYGAMVYNDEGEVAGAVVMMLKGGNSAEVIRVVKERIARIQKSLPEGVVIEPFLDRTKMVNNAISTVKTNLLEGALIVVFVLVLFLGNLRAGLIVASVIPLALLFALICMRIFGVSGNLMSLGALDFGLIVDGAVIIVEAVLHGLHRLRPSENRGGFTRADINETVTESSRRMMGAAVFGQIIILTVYLPVLSLTGIEGKMFRPMAQTVSFALIGAFVLSLTYVPMMTALGIGRRARTGPTYADRALGWLQRRYEPLLQSALRYPKAIIASAALLFGASVWLLTTLGGEFIPRLEEGDFAVDTRVLTGSSLPTTIEATRKTAGILKHHFPEVEKVVTKIGSGEIPTDPMPIEAADMMVILKDKKEWTSASSFDELAEKMSRKLADVPGVTTGFQYPVQMRFNELMTGGRQDVVCKIFGENLDTLAALAQKAGALAGSVKGAEDIYVETVTGLPQIVIRFNREAIALHRLSIAAVNRIIRTAFAGESAGMIYENERRFDLVVRLEPAQRQDLSDIRGLLVTTPAGTQVPLYQLATVEIQEGPNQIQREDARRRISVGFNVRGRDVESVVQELQQRTERQLRLPPGYYILYGGEFQNLVQARQRLSVAVPVALALILLLLYFAFRSLKDGLLIFSAIPLSALGGILALWLRSMPFSISAGVGFIALFGVSVLNGIVLLSEFKRLQALPGADLRQVVLDGTRARLRPVLMTAAVASLGFLPMALSQGAGAEVQRPLATVVIGGLITATLLTLLVLPVLYVFTRQSKPTFPAMKTFVLLLPLLPFCAGAQPEGSRLPLDKMVARAQAQNRSLQATRREADYWKQLKAHVYELPRTQFQAEYGQINSLQNDTRFDIVQPFSLPVVYRRQTAHYEAQLKAAQQLVLLRERELTREVQRSFYRMVDLLERDALLASLDTLQAGAAAAALRRLQAGETNALERAGTEALREGLNVQRMQLYADIRMEQLRLQVLLSTDSLLLPSYLQVRFETAGTPGEVRSHPELLLLEQQVRIAETHTTLEKNRLSPEPTVGYSNQSLRGWQSTDGMNQKYFGGSYRFQTVQAGVALPLFNRAARNRIRAAQLQEQVARLQAEQGQWALTREQQHWEEVRRRAARALTYYDSAGLKHARTLLESARNGFGSGQYDYLQWNQLVQQSLQIRLARLEAIKEYNEASIHLAYYQQP